MVGTRRTNSCDTCRKRRVKCDEARPVCGQCAKKNRLCTESPDPGFVWVKHGQLSVPEPALVEIQEEKCCTPPERPAPRGSLSLVKTTAVSGGAAFVKYRISTTSSQGGKRNQDKAVRRGCNVSTSPCDLPLCPADQLRNRYLEICQHCPDGYRVATMNFRMCDLVPYLGDSRALDDATECFVQAHNTIVRGKRGNAINYGVYSKALLSVKAALQDPVQRVSAKTLGAITMLFLTEVFGRAEFGTNLVSHSKGSAAFVQYAGKLCKNEPLGRCLIFINTGFLLFNSMMNGEATPLSEPDWSWAFFERPEVDCISTLSAQAAWQMAQIVTHLYHIRRACLTTGNLTEAQEIFRKLLSLHRRCIHTVAELDEHLGWEGNLTESVPHISNPPDVANFWFKRQQDAHAATYCWATATHVGRTLSTAHNYLSRFDAAIWSETQAEQAARLTESFAQNICRSMEYSKKFAPIGSLFILFPLTVAWGTVSGPWRDWVLDDVQTLNGSLANYYTAPMMDYMGDWLTGATLVPPRKWMSEADEDENC